MTIFTKFHKDPNKVAACMGIYIKALFEVNAVSLEDDLEKIYHLLSLAHSFAYRGLRLLNELEGMECMETNFKDLIAAIDNDLNKVRCKHDT